MVTEPATMATTFTLDPHVGALPVRFGMTESEVAKVVGPPARVIRNFLEEREEVRDGVNVRYSKGDGTVSDLSLFPTVELLFHGKDLFKEPDPIQVLLRDDPDPFEWVGFVIFLAIGVAVTGYHDDDRSQRAITVSSPGRWDAYRDQLTPMKR